MKNVYLFRLRRLCAFIIGVVFVIAGIFKLLDPVGAGLVMEGYLRFLKAGDSKEVIDIMKDAGVDFTTPAPVQDAMDVFAEQVKELKKCLK